MEFTKFRLFLFTFIFLNNIIFSFGNFILFFTYPFVNQIAAIFIFILIISFIVGLIVTIIIIKNGEFKVNNSKENTIITCIFASFFIIFFYFLYSLSQPPLLIIPVDIMIFSLRPLQFTLLTIFSLIYMIIGIYYLFSKREKWVNHITP